MKRRKRKGRSVQQLLGIRGFTRYGLLTEEGELLFFQVAPTNISVLSDVSIETKIRHLMMVLSGIQDGEILCTDSCECFDDNKLYLLDRIREEENPEIQKLLRQDMDMLTSMQAEMSNARMFVFIKRCRGLKPEQVFDEANKTAKAFSGGGFEVRRMEKGDIKRFLAIYFGASMNGDQLPDVDGAQHLHAAAAAQEEGTTMKGDVEEKEDEEIRTKDFFDCILPGTIRFLPQEYIAGNTYRCVWAVREYPMSTEDQAILSRLADRSGVTLRIYHRMVDAREQRQILNNASRKNRLMSGDKDLTESVQAESNLQDMTRMMLDISKNRERLFHCAVFLELKAADPEGLKNLQSDISLELTRAKISMDRLVLRQREGYLSVFPCGSNRFGIQYERVLPAGSVANLYPFNFSGKTDPKGFYLGRDKYGTNILVDMDCRSNDKTNGNALILGNSGQGKSYLLKLLLTNLRQSGKRIICLDPEQEYEDLTHALGGSYIDFLSGKYVINVLEPKIWSEEPDSEADTEDFPEAFRPGSRLSQHIAFLKDFFRAYKDFTDDEVDTIEIMLEKLYAKFGISDRTDFSKLRARDYPVLSELYNLCVEEMRQGYESESSLYTAGTLRKICLGIHSMCVGADSKYFCGHTNIADDKILCFGIKGLMNTNEKLRNAVLFNILSYMSNALMDGGSTVAAIDELYLFLSNLTAIEYIRNSMKRVRKRDSMVILASQNIEDFLIPAVREMTKPLFSIPTHQFLFYPGQYSPREYMDVLQMEEAEYDLIRSPERGTCLYRCGNERYLLQVMAPEHKAALFGSAGGR